MNYYHAPSCRCHEPQNYGVASLAVNLLRLASSAAWAAARGGRALLERAVWMDHSPGCPRAGCGHHDCCCIECRPPVYAGCCRSGCGGH